MKSRRAGQSLSTRSVEIYWAALLLAMAFVHFHDPRIFSRTLIAHDDNIFIEPLLKLDLGSYFSSWLPDRSHYAFPLRDLTFLIDFKLSNALGVPTYWLSNFCYLVLGVVLASKIFAILFPGRKALIYALTAIVALHPINVEMVQWASMRKHLITSLVVGYGSLHILRLYKNDRAGVSTRDLGKVLTCTLVGLLCWPTPIIWPLAVLWLLRRKLVRQKAPIAALAIGGTVIWAAAFRLISANNTHYSRHAATLFTASGLATAGGWAWRSLGRATFNLLLPIRETAYYDVNSDFNRIGLALLLTLACAFAWLAFRTRRTPEAQRLTQTGADLLAYAGFLFLPQFYVVLTNSGLVWADHYLYTSFPYLVAAVACFAQAGVGKLVAHARTASILAVGLLVAALYTLCSMTQVPTWNDAITLLGACAEQEGAPLCIMLTIEKKLDEHGCASVFPYMDSARTIYEWRRSQGLLDYDSPFQLELPMIESLCTASAGNVPLDQKLKLLDEQEKFYTKPTSLLFARVLSYLTAKDFDRAWSLARATYLDPHFTISSPNEKILTLLGGQAEALCQLSQHFKVHPECPELLAQFHQRTNPFISDAAFSGATQNAWARQLSTAPFLN